MIQRLCALLPLFLCGVAACSPTQPPCSPATCELPAPTCINPTTVRPVSGGASCENDSCRFAFMDQSCSLGCKDGICSSELCGGSRCNRPPAPECADSNTLRTFSASGSCVEQTCTY